MSMSSSRIAAMASGRTRLGFVPALATSKRSPASWRSNPSAIWLRAELPVQRISTRFFSIVISLAPRGTSAACGCMPSRPRASPALPPERLDRCQRRARFRAEERNRGGHGQLEEIRRPDERPRSRYGMLHLEPFHQPVSEARIEINLQGNGNGNQQHMEKAPRDVIRLKGKNEDQRAQQRRRRDRREFRQQHFFKPLPAALAHQQKAQERAGR